MATLDEQIAQSLAESLVNGELKAAPSWGKPLDFGDGYDETPIGLRMPFKILKDAGYVPHEVLQLHEVARLRDELASCGDPAQAERMRRRLGELQQLIALRLERLRVTGSI
jgi:hypothetical protein